MKKIAFAITLISILAMAPMIYAHEGQGEKDQTRLHFELSSQNQNGEENEQDENEFRIRGIVESAQEGSIKVGGLTILIDPSQVDEFKQKGIIDAGDKVKVEGEIIDGTYYAQEITTIGEGQGRFKFEIDTEDQEEESDEISPTPTITPTPTPSGTISPTPTETPSPTPTETSNIEVNVSANGPIALVREFLQQVLSYLEGLVS